MSQQAHDNPFGLMPHDELGAVYTHRDESALYEIVSRRPRAAEQPNRSFVGNVVSRSRLRWSAIFLFFIVGLFFLRAGWLQVVHGNSFRLLADANRTRTHILPAQRGVITDMHSVVLAHNTPSFTLVARIAELPEGSLEREAVLTTAARITGGDTTMFVQMVNDAKATGDVALLIDVPYERALAFAVIDNTLQGVDLVLHERRAYVSNNIPSLSHVLGYTGVINVDEYAREKKNGYMPYERIGKQGIEAEYESLLRGTYGKEIIEVDSLGRYLRTIAKESPVNGEQLTLSIDARLQAYVEFVLAGRLRGTEASRAAVVAMDPRNGEIRALVSWPGYDANLFAAGISEDAYKALLEDPNDPLFPRAYAGKYPSGSTIKPVYAAAALSEGIITPSTSFLSTGGLQIGNRFFPDWRPGGHGVTNVYHAIADSVNTFFYTIGGGYDTFQGLGIDRLMSWAKTFGFGTPSGLDIPGEADGFLPSKEAKEAEKGEPWYIGDTYNVSIGQGDFLVTPVQIARATAVFANGGTLVTPHLVLGDDAESSIILTSDVTTVVRDAMRQTVTNGSATSMQSVPVPVAGKTGTAQWSKSAPPHSWFMGFAPFDDPTLVISVIIENGGNQALAIPVSREILTWYFSQE